MNCILSTSLIQTDFLDITLDLKSRKYWPYHKPNDQPLNIHHQSNHPPAIKKQLPSMLSKRLLQLSCNQEEFEKAVPDYQVAMLKSGFAGEFEYVKTNSFANRSRKRNIMWFDPPYSDHVKTNIGKEFLKLVTIYFPYHHQLHKIWNKNNIKVSYSCMPNMAVIISKHNKISLQNRADPHHTTPPCTIVGIKPTAFWKENAAKVPLYTKLH